MDQGVSGHGIDLIRSIISAWAPEVTFANSD